MTHLTFYGGIGEIGGNKILLEDNYKALFLDFGLSYSKQGRYYEEFLKPRAGAGLLDYLEMGLIPPLEGIYRRDLELENLWPPFRDMKSYRKIDHLDGVLLTHAHFDHSGNISFLNPAIPVYATAETAFLARAIQDSGKSGVDQQICYYGQVSPRSHRGFRQPALASERDIKQQRQFNIEKDCLSLSPAAAEYWEKGFWEANGKKGIASCQLDQHGHCPLNIRSFPVDHSIPGACAWGIETSSGWIIYSGDLRLHGKRRGLTDKFIEEASRLHPKALIIEGTNIQKPVNISEQTVKENAFKVIRNAQGLVIADFSARDMDRLLTFLEIARETQRKLAILPRDAYMLRTLSLLEQGIPDIFTDPNLVVYQETSAAPSVWQQNFFEECAKKIVLAQDVRKAQCEYILSFSFFDINELPSIGPGPGSLYLYSSSEPHGEEQQMDFKRLHAWLEHFEMKPCGMPGEKDGEWTIPEGEEGLHASGHASGPDLVEIARKINPDILIPVHSDHPEEYGRFLKNSRIKVVYPETGNPINI
jgi:ribonuclease J